MNTQEQIGDNIEMRMIVAAQTYALNDMAINGMGAITRIQSAWKDGFLTGYQKGKQDTYTVEQLKKTFEAGQRQEFCENLSHNAGYDREHPFYKKEADLTFE